MPKLTVQRHLTGRVQGQIKTQSLLGRDYLVVPVIAMVEGVRFGANAKGGELGLVEEIQKHPDAWNSKPVVLNHPQDGGSYVSANSPNVLEDYFMGLIMNTKPVDNKLRMEAWLDTGRKEVNEQISTMFERIEAGETVEVSVGFFMDLEETKGTYNDEEYVAVWRNIVPDHLALLEEGTLGACSVEDGCGTHRTQTKGKEMTVNKGCGCQEMPPIELQRSAIQALAQNMTIQEVPTEMLSNEVSQYLRDALETEYTWPYVVGFSQTTVVYEAYSEEDESWDYFQRGFELSEEGKVTFTTEAQPVRLTTKVVPLSGDDLTTNPGKEEDDMPNANQEGQTAEVENADAAPENKNAEVTANTENEGADNAPEDTVEAETAPTPTAQEYIDNAPAEIRDMLSSALSTHNSAKDAVIKALQETGRCQFSEESLRGMSLNELQNLEKLADVPSYEGRSAPVAQASNAGIPSAPKVSERLKPTSA